MEVLNRDNSQFRLKSKKKRKDQLHQSNVSKSNVFKSSKRDSIFSNHFRGVSGYSSTENQTTGLSTFIEKQNNYNEKTLKDKNKITINLNNKLNQNNIDYVFINKTKAFDYLEELDNLSDSEYNISKLKIPKLDFSKIFENYQNTLVKVRIVKGSSSNTKSTKRNLSSTFSFQKEQKRDKKKKKQSNKRKKFFDEQGKFFSNINYVSKKSENVFNMYTKIFESLFEENLN